MSDYAVGIPNKLNKGRFMDLPKYLFIKINILIY